jgi:stage V sporulation protein G
MSKTQTFAPVPENPAQPLPMKVDVKISSIRPEGNIRAYASINLNDCFAISNVKVVDSSKGLFIAMPSYKAGNGEYKDICFPVSKQFREQLNNAVIDAYHQALAQSQQQGAIQVALEATEQSSDLRMG